MSNRDTYKYRLKVGNKIVYAGTTDDPERRAGEHQSKPKFANAKLVVIGNRTTKDAARKWEANEEAKGIPIGS